MGYYLKTGELEKRKLTHILIKVDLMETDGYTTRYEKGQGKYILNMLNEELRVVNSAYINENIEPVSKIKLKVKSIS